MRCQSLCACAVRQARAACNDVVAAFRAVCDSVCRHGKTVEKMVCRNFLLSRPLLSSLLREASRTRGKSNLLQQQRLTYSLTATASVSEPARQVHLPDSGGGGGRSVVLLNSQTCRLGSHKAEQIARSSRMKQLNTHPLQTLCISVRSHAAANLTGPHISANLTGPHISTNLVGPQISANLTGPHISANLTSPQISANLTGPQISANLTGPQISANLTGPQISANLTGLRLQIPSDLKAKTVSVGQLRSPLCHFNPLSPAFEWVMLSTIAADPSRFTSSVSQLEGSVSLQKCFDADLNSITGKMHDVIIITDIFHRYDQVRIKLYTSTLYDLWHTYCSSSH